MILIIWRLLYFLKQMLAFMGSYLFYKELLTIMALREAGADSEPRVAPTGLLLCLLTIFAPREAGAEKSLHVLGPNHRDAGARRGVHIPDAHAEPRMGRCGAALASRRGRLAARHRGCAHRL